mmetsp:Transcript_2129/g.6321  ORF Transcript_2129/g.6321 Transcript_2129/m.6321 type:complete len:218 (-) Transcript_2129:297-950(-)
MRADTSRMLVSGGYRHPSPRSSALASLDRARAATKKMWSDRCDAPAASAPSPMPGNTYALLPCPGRSVRQSISTGSKGLPLANTARPPVQRYACSAVHSALDVGLLSAKMSGCSCASATARHTGSSNTPGTAHTPTSTDGRSRCTACRRSEHGSPSWAKGRLCGLSLLRREATTSPLESTSQILCRASSSEHPVSCEIAYAIRLAMPVPASPAPMNR